MMQDTTVVTLAKVMKSISHPIRLKILCLLVDGGLTVGQIHDHLTTSYANVSQHLQRLHHHGLVSADKRANFVHYAIAVPSVREMIRTLRRLYCVSPATADADARQEAAAPSTLDPPGGPF